MKERLRNEARRRAIVVVHIRDIVRVELELAVVQVEVRRAREPTIGARIIVFAHP